MFCYDALAAEKRPDRLQREALSLSNGISRVARFEKVSIGQFREAAHKALPGLSDADIDAAYAGVTLPRRATAGSSGYDIRTPFTFTLKSGEDIVEYKLRRKEESTEMSSADAVKATVDFIRSELKRLGHDPVGDEV